METKKQNQTANTPFKNVNEMDNAKVSLAKITENMRKNDLNNIYEDDILYGDMGYNMIIPVFYKVLKRTAKMVVIKELETIETGDGGFLTGTSVPKLDTFDYYAKEIRCRVKNKCYRDREYVVIKGHTLLKWDGKPKEFDHAD